MDRDQIKEQWPAPGLVARHINRDPITALVLQLHEKQKEPGLLFAGQT